MQRDIFSASGISQSCESFYVTIGVIVKLMDYDAKHSALSAQNFV